MKTPIYDTHCHLLYKGYITRRILYTLLDLMSDLDKLISYNKFKNEATQKQKIKISSLIKRTINVINLMMSSSSQDVLHHLEHSYGQMDLIIVPLAYDVSSCFQEAYAQDISTLTIRQERDLLNDIRNDLLFILDRYVQKLTHYKIFSQLKSLHNKLELLTNNKNTETRALNSKDVYMFQLNQLLELKQAYPGRVYPFLYVDPRRAHTLRLAKELVGKDKPFLGIKLYTPNGYSPLDQNLLELYEYCQQEQIPITAHNAYGGFSTFVKKLEIKGGFFRNGQIIEHNGWIEFETDFFTSPHKAILERAERLNHPMLWAKVLELFPQLRLNLAHFGGDGKHWQEHVIKLMIKYANVYTDLSCQTQERMLQHIKKNYLHLAPQKFLYGSDYYLNLFFIDSFQQYFANFLKVFDDTELERLTYQNAQAFLFASKKVIS